MLTPVIKSSSCPCRHVKAVLCLCKKKGRDGFSRLAAVSEAGGSAQIHLPLPRDDAGGCFARRIPSRDFEAACRSTAGRLHPGPWADRSVTAAAFGHNRLAVNEVFLLFVCATATKIALLCLRSIRSVRCCAVCVCHCVCLCFKCSASARVWCQSWSTVGGNSRMT